MQVNIKTISKWIWKYLHKIFTCYIIAYFLRNIIFCDKPIIGIYNYCVSNKANVIEKYFTIISIINNNGFLLGGILKL